MNYFEMEAERFYALERALGGEYSRKLGGLAVHHAKDKYIVILPQDDEAAPIAERMSRVSLVGSTKFHPMVRYSGDYEWNLQSLSELESLSTLTGIAIGGAVIRHPDSIE